VQCGKGFDVLPYRAATAKFCSYECRGDWRRINYRGEANPRWTGGKRSKKCQGCGVTMEWSGEPISTFRKRKFCTKACADEHGFRYSGEQHPNWTGGNRKRPNQQAAWAAQVISRDKATCRTCGAVGVELHAHHVKPYKDHPELRWQVSNGLTLCARCHWAIHSASNANAVNSGNPQHELGGGNPEPSPDRKVREGVTTRGRAYRRVEGPCRKCGAFVSRRASSAVGQNLFCSKSCASSFNVKAGRIGRQKRPRQ